MGTLQTRLVGFRSGGGEVQLESGAAAVGEQQTFEAAVVGLAQRGVDALEKPTAAHGCRGDGQHRWTAPISNPPLNMSQLRAGGPVLNRF